MMSSVPPGCWPNLGAKRKWGLKAPTKEGQKRPKNPTKASAMVVFFFNKK
jgi:hypothetical protein